MRRSNRAVSSQATSRSRRHTPSAFAGERASGTGAGPIVASGQPSAPGHPQLGGSRGGERPDIAGGGTGAGHAAGSGDGPDDEPQAPVADAPAEATADEEDESDDRDEDRDDEKPEKKAKDANDEDDEAEAELGD